MMQPSELILNADDSIYHLHLKPEDVAPTIITVGDPNRVAQVSKHFDQIEVKKAYREFVTHTGTLNGKRITVISTGIGTDNIDIVVNELDALFNIDLNKRMVRPKHTVLTFIRIGTSGSLRKNIPVDTFLASEYAVGLDGLMYFYDNYKAFECQALTKDLNHHQPQLQYYTSAADESLMEQFATEEFQKGITLTCNGFYGPQGRQMRLAPRYPHLFDELDDFSFRNRPITNMEMETSGIYLLAKMLGHRAISLNVLLANRRTGVFSKHPKVAIERLIQNTLSKI